MDYLGFKLWDLSNKWQKELLKKLTILNITHVQFLLLKAIYELQVQQEDTTQIKISKQASTDIMMTSKVIRTLQQKGFVDKVPHRMDKRAFTITITKNGKKSLKKAPQPLKGP